MRSRCRRNSCAWLASEGIYEFKVDLNGDAVEDTTCRITFDERDKRGKHRETQFRLTKDKDVSEMSKWKGTEVGLVIASKARCRRETNYILKPQKNSCRKAIALAEVNEP